MTVTDAGPRGPYAFDLNPAAGSTPGENLFGTATPQLVGAHQLRPGPSPLFRLARTY